MPDGHILDPRLNIGTGGPVTAKPYGFLTKANDGHIYMYLKDEESQFYTHGTPLGPLTLRPLNLVDPSSGAVVTTIDVYVGIRTDSMTKYPVVESMNDFAKGKTAAGVLETKSKDVRNKIKVK